MPARPPDALAASDARSVQRAPFQYAVVRVVPRVERGEGFNAGVIVFCRPKRFLAARVALDRELLARFAPQCDPDVVERHLQLIPALAAGDPAAGPLAALSQPERFHWLVAPASTVVQPAEVHTGMSADPAGTLEHLFALLVERSAGPS
ncbi:MAG: DUF3037 domain-containing protein [Chloroflexota bacterium]